MKPFSTLTLIISLFIFASCGQAKTQNAKEVVTQVEPVKVQQEIAFDTKPKDILKDFTIWYNYTYYNIRLSQDFIGLNKDSVAIDKKAFLDQLLTGNYLPVKIKEKEGLAYYQLYKLESRDKSIGNTLKQMAGDELEMYKRVGKVFPAFNWTGLDGKAYNNSNTKGKIVVVKCWFINCVACVKEFPELNQLVEEYKNRNDIVFISLATDPPQQLQDFLSKREFKYAVVPNQGQYMESVLNITSYPTHFIIGKDGNVASVVSNSTDMVAALQKEASKG